MASNTETRPISETVIVIPNSNIETSSLCISRVLVQRDYGGNDPFVIKFSEEAVSEFSERHMTHLWQETVGRINEICREAAVRDCWTLFLEEVINFFTFYLFITFRRSHYKKHMDKLEDYIKERNEIFFQPLGMHIKNPTLNGLRFIEVKITRVSREDKEDDYTQILPNEALENNN